MADCIQISWNLPSGLCVAWDLMGRTVRDSWDFPLLSRLPHSCWERRSQNHWIDINQLTVALTLLIARVGCSCRIQRGKSKYLSVCYSLHCSVVQESVPFFSWFDFIFPTYTSKTYFVFPELVPSLIPTQVFFLYGEMSQAAGYLGLFQ